MDANRPRAGTMPSLAGLTSSSTSPSLQVPSMTGNSALSQSTNSGLRVPPYHHHPHEFASQPPSPANNSAAGTRSRSGSLTLPPPIPTPGSTAAFSGFFTGPWTPQSSSSAQGHQQTQGHAVVNKPRSASTATTPDPPPSMMPTAAAAAAESVKSDESGTDDSHLVRTLDYLGLHDNAASPPQREAQISRNRANTLAAPPIRRRPSAHLLTNPLSMLPEAQSPPQPSQSYLPVQVTQHVDQQASAAPNQQPPSSLFPSMTRPRASTALPNEPMNLSRKRAGTTSLLQSTALNNAHGASAGYGDETTSSSDDSSVLAANLSSASSIPLAGSGANSPSNRSLWIGQLPKQTTLADLYASFGTYGPIESVRFQPDRSYAVVNFTSSQLAVDAKQDITHRLQGRLWGVPVRLAYGSESSPETTPELRSSASNAAAPVSDAAPSSMLLIRPVPSAVSSADLVNLLTPLGPVEHARLTAQQPQGALVVMRDVESAVRMAVALSGREIWGAEQGPVKVCFAKNAEEAAALVGPSTSPQLGYPSQMSANNRAPASMMAGPSSAGAGTVGLPGLPELLSVLRELAGPHDPDLEKDEQAFANMAPPAAYFTAIPPPLSDQIQTRKKSLEAPFLRELRKRLDTQVVHQADIDTVAEGLLEDAAFLSSDYIGNTIIQKFFEKCSLGVKIALLQRISPHLASVGTNKHGTWAAQKIIDVAGSANEVALICSSLSLYIPPLLLDQFGNYVVQCTMRFGSPATDPVMDAMFHRCWDIAHGRFGARSMRTILESQFTTRYQQKRIAVALILNAVPLSMNSNGALLLTWLLDTSELPGRYAALTTRLLPHLPMLCTHKVASNTILRLINQRNDVAAQQTLISAIFNDSTAILEQLLLDQSHGLGMVQRMLSSAHIEQSQRANLVAKVRSLLVNLPVDSGPGFTRVLSDLAEGNLASAQAQTAPSGQNRRFNKRGDEAQNMSPWANPMNAQGSMPQFAPFAPPPGGGYRGGNSSGVGGGVPGATYGLVPPMLSGSARTTPTSRSPKGPSGSVGGEQPGLSLPASIFPPPYATPNGLPFVQDYGVPGGFSNTR